MSIQSSILLLLLISSYMHACSGRPLSKHSRKHLHHHSAKVVMSDPSEVKKSSISNEFNTGDVQEKPKDLTIVTKHDGQEMKRMKNNPSVSFRVPRTKQGNEVKKPFDEDLQQSNMIDEGTEMMQGRSLLGSETQKTEENINDKETGVAEDVVAMDYEPPHRKPPIHN